MNRFYIRHKVKVGDITNLSDSISERVIAQGDLCEEDLIDVEAPNGLFKARVTYIDRVTVEVEIIKKSGEKLAPDLGICILQSISNDSKYNFVIEKSVELGVTKIIPIESEYSQVSLKSARKKVNSWRANISRAVEQSRNTYPPEIITPIKIENMKEVIGEIEKGELRIALTTEDPSAKHLDEIAIKDYKDIKVAIGPETGWSSKDLELLKRNGFQNITLQGFILRTETAPVVITSIIKFIHGKI